MGSNSIKVRLRCYKPGLWMGIARNTAALLPHRDFYDDLQSATHLEKSVSSEPSALR